MTDIDQHFKQLKACVANELICSDGEKVIAYTETALTADEIELFKTITAEDLYQYLESVGFKSYKMGSA